MNSETDVRNYADSATFRMSDKNLNSLKRKLEVDSLLSIEWFNSNNLKLNAGKCNFVISGQKHESVWEKVGEATI